MFKGGYEAESFVFYSRKGKEVGVRIGSFSGGFYIDDDELIRMRVDMIDPWENVELGPIGKPPKLREYTPGCMIFLNDKLWEILAVFRIQEDPFTWRYLCQEIKDLGAERRVPVCADSDYGFDWSQALPKVVWEIMPSEGFARIFFSCFWDAREGPVTVFKNQEMLRCRLLVKVEYKGSDLYIEDPKALPSPARLALPSPAD